MKETMYYCPQCQKAIAEQDAKTKGLFQCPSCNGELIPLPRYKDTWESMTPQDQKCCITQALKREQDREVRQTGHASKTRNWIDSPQSKEHPWNDCQDSQVTSSLSLPLGLIGSFFFILAGIKMLGITSQATANGDVGSIAEIFYNAMGFLSFGLACLSATIGYIGWKK